MFKNRVLFLTKTIAICCTVTFASNLSPELLAQSGPGIFSRLTLDNGNAIAADDYGIFTSVSIIDGRTTTSFSGTGLAQFTHVHDTPTGAMTLGANGLGIGLSGFGSSDDANAQAALHVVGGQGAGGTGPPFGEAKVIIEDRNTTTDARELLNLTNNGAVSLRMDNRDSDTFFKIENVVGGLEFSSDAVAAQSGPVQMRIDSNAKLNSLNLNSGGVGIGTLTPGSSLHVMADGTGDFTSATIQAEVTNALPAQDRVMLDLKNNGTVYVNLTDTSTANASPFQISASNARLSFQQNGGNRAGFAVFEDGAVRYVANGTPNMTVTGNGNVNVIGQGNGGNLNVIGPTGGAPGNLFVAGNISYGGTISGPSDRNIKENFQEIDPQEILKKVAELPITQWNYTNDINDTLHVGPMAQDFFAAFGLGDSTKRIPLMDSDGVALAAIKGLNQIVESKDKMISELKGSMHDQAKSLKDQAELISELTDRLERLETIVVVPIEN